MKKKIFVSIVLLTVTAAVSCGFGKYSDVKAHIDDIIDYQYSYIEKLEKAEKGEDVARALNEYVDTMIQFSKDWKKLSDKYPVLKTDTYPDELKEHMDKFQETIHVVQSRVAGPLLRYSLDPAVLKAQKRYTEKLLEAGSGTSEK